MSFKSVNVIMLNGKNLFDGVVGTPMRENFPMIKKSYDGFEQGGYLFYHLYFLSDEEIKEGDWYVNKHSQVLKYSLCQDLFHVIGQDLFHVKGKIIATTDKSLTSINPEEDDGRILLPQPSQQFIEKYVEAYNSGNPITKVMVEYEEYAEGSYGLSNGEPLILERLKISKENIITIRKVKDSWSRDEVKTLFNRYNEFIAHHEPEEWKEWIEENL